MNANELADELQKMFVGEEYDRLVHEIPDLLRQQQAEIDRLNYDMEGFKQNFFVSGFHLQIKMANEQLLKQQEQIDTLKNANRFIQNFAEEQHQRAVALESELDRAVELYTDKAIENKALKKELYFKDYYEELPDTPVDLLRKAQEK